MGRVRWVLLLAVLCAALVAAPSAGAVTFTVNSTGDQADADIADAACDTDSTTPGAQCTLSAALTEAELTDAPDDIGFNLVAMGTDPTITVETTFPPITNPLTINGCSATPNNPGPCVGLRRGESAGGTQIGLNFNRSGAFTVRGLAFTNWNAAIRYDDLTSPSTGFNLQNNWFGIELDEDAGANNFGVVISGSNITIGGPGGATGTQPADRNVFANNPANAIVLSGGDGDLATSDNDKIQGNYFGVLADGVTEATPGNGDNIEIVDATTGGFGSAVAARGTLVGGTVSPAAAATAVCDHVCNVIAGADIGVDLVGESGSSEDPAGPDTTVAGNFLGLDRTGAASIENTTGLFTANSEGVTIGGSAAGAENHITGGDYGLLATNTPNLVIQGNTIGLDSTGGSSLNPPSTEPVSLQSSGADLIENTIVADPAADEAVGLGGSGLLIDGNTIGITADGDSASAGINAIRAAFVSNSSFTGNTIGNAAYIGAAFGNGISLEGSSNNVFTGNFLGTDASGADHGNSGSGIRISDFTTTDSTGNTLGAAATGDENQENVISFNGNSLFTGSDAITVVDDGNDDNLILRNRGRGNEDLFVDLDDDGAGNSAADGPNRGIQAPAPTLVTVDADSIDGAAGSVGAGATVRVFRTYTADGDIRDFVGEVTANADGSWELEHTFPAGTCLTATQESAGTDDTSEAPAAKPVSSTQCDTTPPAAPNITGGPSGPTNESAPTFTFTGEPGATFACSVDGTAPVACNGGSFTAPTQAEGPHTFTVTQTDAVGNASPPANRPFTVDTVAPGPPVITDGPPVNTTDSTPSFTFAGETNASFTCRIDSGASTPCNGGGFTADALSDGPHTFRVTQSDQATNVGPEATRSFTVDTAAPDTQIDSGPGEGAITDSTPAFGFSSPGNSGVGFRCRFDSQPFGACRFSGQETPASALSAGRHVFEVRAVDPAGNVDATPAQRRFTVGACRGKAATYVGNAKSNLLTAGPRADVILGLAGGDLIRGLGGNDVACGGGGRDRLIGGPGNDTLLGQGAGDVLRGGAGKDKLIGGAGKDSQKQ